MQFIPLPPEGSVATSLLTGKPAPSPLFNRGPSDGFSCHVNPSKLIAAYKEKERLEEEVWGHEWNGELLHLKACQATKTEEAEAVSVIYNHWD